MSRPRICPDIIIWLLNVSGFNADSPRLAAKSIMSVEASDIIIGTGRGNGCFKQYRIERYAKCPGKAARLQSFGLKVYIVKRKHRKLHQEMEMKLGAPPYLF